MSSLLEKIAAKKAAEAAAKALLNAPAATVAPLVEEKPAVVERLDVPPGKTAVEAPADKPLSFAEKMAAKKAAALGAPLPAVPAIVDAPLPAVVDTIVVDAPIEPKVEAPKPEAPKEEEAVDLTDIPAEDAQAYLDIKSKLNRLSALDGSFLESAMKDLKKALMDNPQACYLILPQDIGKMVIALRAMKNEVIEAATETKEKAPKKAKASKALTAEEIAEAFDSL